MDRRKPRVVLKKKVKQRYVDINVAFALVDYVERSRAYRQVAMGWGNLSATDIRNWLWNNCSHKLDGTKPIIKKGHGGLVKIDELVKFLYSGKSDKTAGWADSSIEHLVQLIRRAGIYR